ncbi:hypothetical protein CASFOL_004896 [Castilleja foliolosa]|uniref:Uncharacterized protein n=1 Tax=Castilleja foliolosa TaxID=1961234 RepID=A0ABD3EFG3_9LAMI
MVLKEATIVQANIKEISTDSTKPFAENIMNRGKENQSSNILSSLSKTGLSNTTSNINTPQLNDSGSIIIYNSQKPGQRRRTQLLDKSFIDLRKNNLAENTLTYASDVPVDIIGLSNTTSTLATHDMIVSGRSE